MQCFQCYTWISSLNRIKGNYFNNEKSTNMFSTVVGVYINTMKTTFDLNFDSYETVKQHGYAVRTSIEVQRSCHLK